jgi:hypothetical protein
VVGSPFTDSAPDHAGASSVVRGVSVGVAGWNASAAGSERCTRVRHGGVRVCGGLGRCWVLRRHLVGVLSGRSWSGLSNALVCGCGGGGGVGVWLCVECCIVDASILLCGQVCKGTWWMSGHQEPMKDVGGRDSPRGVVNRAVIRGCPNGVTQHPSWGVTSI